MILAEKDKGRIIQVKTGEGKSTIICVFAIFNALKGKKVDIVTNSVVLAERDANDKKNFIKCFNSAAHIIIKGIFCPKTVTKKILFMEKHQTINLIHFIINFSKLK